MGLLSLSPKPHILARCGCCSHTSLQSGISMPLRSFGRSILTGRFCSRQILIQQAEEDELAAGRYLFRS